ncbi:rhodanese-like domain-containing protein [archaeon]|jgi:rhodanese-related sulfurtransferase|nr:rhodanese-like domain-containing protein [archaeon]
MVQNKKANRSIIGITFFVILIAVGFFWNFNSESPSTGEVIENEMEMYVNGEKDMEMQTAYIDISAREAKELIDMNSNIVIIDVSPFYQSGHIPGALWYYYGDGSLDAAIPGLDKEKSYIVYCHFDGPSIAGAQKLVDSGFKVYRLADHFSGWEDAGYEVEI